MGIGVAARMIQRFDARLATDACGNKDVIMREAHDGLFIRHEDYLLEAKRMKELLKAASHTLRSYQYGNSATELAKGMADKIDEELK